jgi:aldose 1-epimerase
MPKNMPEDMPENMNKTAGHITLAAGDLSLVLTPALGGAIAGFTQAGFALMRVSPPAPDGGHALSCFPLVPFSNRIADGAFTVAGRRYQLNRLPRFAPHAIHGEGWVRPWRVAAASAAAATLVLDHDAAEPGSWPFPFRAEQHFSLDQSALAVRLSLVNTGALSMPAGIGLHPYFPRHDGVVLGFRAASVWRNGPDQLPAARAEPPPPEWRFDPPRPLGAPGLDNCFAGWSGTTSIAWPAAGRGLEITADACFGHAVVYTPAGGPDFAFEPVSNMNDAINRMEIVPDHGLVVLAPGAALTGLVRFAVAR